MSTTSPDNQLREDISAIDQKRRVLQQIVEITLEAPAEEPAKMGFSVTARRWLDSPWEVSWDPTKKPG